MESERVRARLQAERERLNEIKHAGDLQALKESERESFQELSSVDQHLADHGTQTFERQKAHTILLSVEERLTDVERAFAKLERGNYGECEICGKPIPIERLEARPATRYCAQDAERLEAQGIGLR